MDVVSPVAEAELPVLWEQSIASVATEVVTVVARIMFTVGPLWCNIIDHCGCNMPRAWLLTIPPAFGCYGNTRVVYRCGVIIGADCSGCAT